MLTGYHSFYLKGKKIKKITQVYQHEYTTQCACIKKHKLILEIALPKETLKFFCHNLGDSFTQRNFEILLSQSHNT